MQNIITATYYAIYGSFKSMYFNSLSAALTLQALIIKKISVYNLKNAKKTVFFRFYDDLKV